jgi:hypothetical protein
MCTKRSKKEKKKKKRKRTCTEIIYIYKTAGHSSRTTGTRCERLVQVQAHSAHDHPNWDRDPGPPAVRLGLG